MEHSVRRAGKAVPCPRPLVRFLAGPAGSRIVNSAKHEEPGRGRWEVRAGCGPHAKDPAMGPVRSRCRHLRTGPMGHFRVPADQRLGRPAQRCSGGRLESTSMKKSAIKFDSLARRGCLTSSIARPVMDSAVRNVIQGGIDRGRRCGQRAGFGSFRGRISRYRLRACRLASYLCELRQGVGQWLPWQFGSTRNCGSPPTLVLGQQALACAVPGRSVPGRQPADLGRYRCRG